MVYEILRDKNFPTDWRCEAIDIKSGDCFVVMFSGPDAGNRATEYIRYKNWVDVNVFPAPKGGKEFLAYDRNQNWKGIAWYDRIHKHFVYTGGFWLPHFTHWQPIPDTP